MTSTTIQQGRFTSDGTAKILNLRADADWMEVYNSTVADDDTQTTAVGVQYYWQRGMSAGTGIEYKKSDAANAAQLTTLLATGGFSPSGGFSQGAPVVGTTITKANPAVCTALAHGYSNGDAVILSNLTEMPQLGQIVFTIGSVTPNTFELTYLNTNTPNFTAETAFTVRKIVGTPTWRQSVGAVVDITPGATTQVALSQDGGLYAVGDVMRMATFAATGMREISGLQGTILSINSSTNTYTLDIDSSTFSSYNMPAPSAVPFTIGQMQPVGTISSTTLSDATKNLSTLSMTLGAGANGPAGVTSDVIYWRAGKSFSVENE